MRTHTPHFHIFLDRIDGDLKTFFKNRVMSRHLNSWFSLNHCLLGCKSTKILILFKSLLKTMFLFDSLLFSPFKHFLQLLYFLYKNFRRYKSIFNFREMLSCNNFSEPFKTENSLFEEHQSRNTHNLHNLNFWIYSNILSTLVNFPLM